MNLETALTLTNPAELSDEELLDLAAAVAEHRAQVLDAFRRYEFEINQRLIANNASVLRAGDMTVERPITKAYQWDYAALEKLAPSQLEYVPAKQIPASWRVLSTVKLNNYIAKLGDSPDAKALLAARHVEEKPMPLRFTRQPSEAEVVAQLTESVARKERINQMVEQLEAGR